MDLDCYYDLLAKEKTLVDCNYTEEDLEREFNKVLNKFLNIGIYKYDNDEYIKNLSLCIRHLDFNFINNCLNVNIDDIMNDDMKHHYSTNFKKIIINMFEIEKEIMNQQLKLMLKNNKVK
ncbi:MAG: hypothetical protein IJY25_03705 [Bacilli bacterium]|nr:hypothetical protein [Bacilli bacterium]